MKRVFALAGVVALAVVFAGAAVAEEKDTKEKKADFDLKKFMKEAHVKDGNYRDIIKADIKGEKWEDASKIAKMWLEGAESMAKLTPKKGGKDSWEKKTASYVKTISTLKSALDDKDAKKANGTFGAIGSSCGACHKEHKGK